MDELGGWVDNFGLNALFLTIFQSYQDAAEMIMKG